MTRHSVRAGRGLSRPALWVAGSVFLSAGALFVAGSRAGEPHRGPVSVPNRDATAPTESTIAGVRHVTHPAAPEIAVIDSTFPTRNARLLFFAGRPARPRPQGDVLTLDGTGGVLSVDRRMQVHRVWADPEGRQITSVAAAPDGGLWLATGDGEVLLVDRDGSVLVSLPGAFDYPEVASDREGRAWLVRSHEHLAFRPEFGATPLLVRLDAEGEAEATLGSGVIPRDFLLAHLASSGRIAVTDSVIYYAPFIRDEVVALSTSGDTLWVTRRELPQSTSEPRFELDDGEPTIDYAPVNLGIALGPDGRLYVLSVPGFTTSEGRLDVVDAETGYLVRTAELPVPLPTLAADEEGRIYLLDELRLLTGVPPIERLSFPAFDLELLGRDGHHMSLHDLAGRVALINFWASWCEPCRTEMPALDALQQSIENDEFIFLTMNEDVNPKRAAEFLSEYGFGFPTILGRGRLRGKYHYVGLPFTVLLDREGRVVQRWIGFAGEQQIQSIRAVVMAELNREMSASDGHQHGRH